jgi:hypothetical protein
VNHVQALEETHAITLVRPFYGGGQKELVKMPKVYGFDTGFVSFCKGWDPLRPDDYGMLWEHVVLEYLQAHEHDKRIHYWRDSAGHEIDFVIPKSRDAIDVIECKWDPTHFESTSLKLFRSYYPKGNNFIVSPLNREGYSKKLGGLTIFICNPDGYLNKRHG